MTDSSDRLTKPVGGMLTESEYASFKAATESRAISVSRLIRLLILEWMERDRGNGS